MGYSPLKKEEPTMNVLIVSDSDNSQNEYFSIRLMHQVDIKLRERNCKTVLISNINSYSAKSLQHTIRLKSVNAVVVIDEIHEEILNTILAGKVPFVRSGTYSSSVPADCVMEDNISAMAQTVKYLVANGYEKLGFVGPLAPNKSFSERLMGFWFALRQNNLEQNDAYFHIDDLYENYCNANYLAERFKGAAMPEVFVCANDRTLQRASKP